MRDEIDGRFWVEHGHAFSETVAAFFARAATAAGAALRRLEEIEFDAPWKADPCGPGQA